MESVIKSDIKIGENSLLTEESVLMQVFESSKESTKIDFAQNKKPLSDINNEVKNNNCQTSLDEVEAENQDRKITENQVEEDKGILKRKLSELCKDEDCSLFGKPYPHVILANCQDSVSNINSNDENEAQNENGEEPPNKRVKKVDIVYNDKEEESDRLNNCISCVFDIQDTKVDENTQKDDKFEEKFKNMNDDLLLRKKENGDASISFSKELNKASNDIVQISSGESSEEEEDADDDDDESGDDEEEENDDDDDDNEDNNLVNKVNSAPIIMNNNNNINKNVLNKNDLSNTSITISTKLDLHPNTLDTTSYPQTHNTQLTMPSIIPSHPFPFHHDAILENQRHRLSAAESFECGMVLLEAAELTAGKAVLCYITLDSMCMNINSAGLTYGPGIRLPLNRVIFWKWIGMFGVKVLEVVFNSLAGCLESFFDFFRIPYSILHSPNFVMPNMATLKFFFSDETYKTYMESTFEAFFQQSKKPSLLRQDPYGVCNAPFVGWVSEKRSKYHTVLCRKKRRESMLYRPLVWPFIKYVPNPLADIPQQDNHYLENYNKYLMQQQQQQLHMQHYYNNNGMHMPFNHFNNNANIFRAHQHKPEKVPSPTPVVSGFTGKNIALFTYQPANSKGGISISNEDLFCLNKGEYLNDVIIDFYLKYIMEEIVSQIDKDRTHVFSSFFYSHLISNNNNNNSNLNAEEQRHSKVRRWTRNVDLFSKDFIIVPINESYHWFLAIICFPNERNKRTKTNIAPSTDAAKNAAVTTTTSLASKCDSNISTSMVSVCSTDTVSTDVAAKNTLGLIPETADTDEKNRELKIDSTFCDQSDLVAGSKEEGDSVVKDNAEDANLFDNLESNIFIRNGEECGDGDGVSPVDLMEDFLSEVDRNDEEKKEEGGVMLGGEEGDVLMGSNEKDVALPNEEDEVMENEKNKLKTDEDFPSTNELETESKNVVDEFVDSNVNEKELTEEAVPITDAAASELPMKESEEVNEKNDNIEVEMREKIEDVNINEDGALNDELKDGEESKRVLNDDLKPDSTFDAVSQSTSIPVEAPNNTDENLSSNPNLQPGSETVQATPSDELVTSDVAPMITSAEGTSVTTEITPEVTTELVPSIPPESVASLPTEIVPDETVASMPTETVPNETIATPAPQPIKIDLLEEANPARNPCILIFDSLKGDNRFDVVNILRQYLQVEWNTRKKESEGDRSFDRNNMKGAMVNCPQQCNTSDCGIYMLQFVESFFRDKVEDFTLPIHLDDWFKTEEVMSKRRKLARLIMDLKEQLNPDLVYNPNDDGCLNISDEEDDDDDDDDEEDDEDEDDSVIDYGTTDEDFKNQLREKTKKLSATDSYTFSGPDSDDDEMNRIYKFCNNIIRRLVDKVCSFDSKSDCLISCDEEEEEKDEEEEDEGDNLKDENILKNDDVVMRDDNNDHAEVLESNENDVNYDDSADSKDILSEHIGNDNVKFCNDVNNNNGLNDKKDDEDMKYDALDDASEDKKDPQCTETTSDEVSVEIKSLLKDDKIDSFKDSRDLIVEEKNHSVNNEDKVINNTSV